MKFVFALILLKAYEQYLKTMNLNKKNLSTDTIDNYH